MAAHGAGVVYPQVQDLRFIPEVLTAPERNKRVREVLRARAP